MPVFGIRAADARDAREIVATRTKPLPDLLDTLKAIPAVGGGVLLIVLGVEVAEVPLEDGVELIATTGNVSVPSRGRDRGRRAHMNSYGRIYLLASGGGLVYRLPHNMTHSPNAFSSLRYCDGAGDARVIRSREYFCTIYDSKYEFGILFFQALVMVPRIHISGLVRIKKMPSLVVSHWLKDR